MLEREKALASQRIFQGYVFNLRLDFVSLQNGNTSTREIVEHPGGVVVVAMDDDYNISVVKQYRRPFDDFLLELPAGKLNPGEDHRDCGLRELKEETGYTCESFEYLGYIYPSPGFCSEILHMYLATKLTKGEQELDQDEFVDVYSYNINTLKDMVLRGEIADAKSVAAILKVYMMIQEK